MFPQCEISLFFHVSLNCRELLNQNHFVLNHHNIRNLPHVAHHNGGNSVHQRQRDCHTLGKPSGLTVRCLAETTGERPCFAFAWLSKYEKDTMPSHLTRCWKATKHLRGTRTRCFSRKLSIFPRNCRSEPHGVIRMYDWSNDERTSTIFDLSSLPRAMPASIFIFEHSSQYVGVGTVWCGFAEKQDSPR